MTRRQHGMRVLGHDARLVAAAIRSMRNRGRFHGLPMELLDFAAGSLLRAMRGHALTIRHVATAAHAC